MIDKEKVLIGRLAVDAYREAHFQLHLQSWYRGMAEAHTPLLEKLIIDLEKIGYASAEYVEVLHSFFGDSKELNKQESGVYEVFDREPLLSRKDLALIGEPREVDGAVIMNIGGEIYLTIDDEFVMSTSCAEHWSMEKAMSECPDNSRCFIGGLGLGVILLHLAESGKSIEVIVCEIDKRVIELFPGLVDYFAINYPAFNVSIIQGDAREEIKKHGRFDWVFFDFFEPTPVESLPDIGLSLTLKGAYTSWMPREVPGWQ